jgi:hypothetical protein
MKRVAAIGLAAVSFSTASCYHEPLRTDYLVSDTYTSQLELAKGTTVEDARKLMKDRGMTGIVRESLAVKGGAHWQVLAADYQKSLYLFQSGVYDKSIPLRCRSIPPYGFGLNFGEYEGRTYLMALYRDPLDSIKTDLGLAAQPPRIELFELSEDEYKRRGTLFLRKLSKEHNGLMNPLFVGNDLELGITFIATGLNGFVWSRAYFLKLVEDDSGGLKLRIAGSVLREEAAAGCSCVRDYVNGQ